MQLVFRLAPWMLRDFSAEALAEVRTLVNDCRRSPFNVRLAVSRLRQAREASFAPLLEAHD